MVAVEMARGIHRRGMASHPHLHGGFPIHVPIHRQRLWGHFSPIPIPRWLINPHRDPYPHNKIVVRRGHDTRRKISMLISLKNIILKVHLPPMWVLVY
jgi:hypothetical protein